MFSEAAVTDFFLLKGFLLQLIYQVVMLSSFMNWILETNLQKQTGLSRLVHIVVRVFI